MNLEKQKGRDFSRPFHHPRGGDSLEHAYVETESILAEPPDGTKPSGATESAGPAVVMVPSGDARPLAEMRCSHFPDLEKPVLFEEVIS